jgi:hypothetical protein
LSKFGDSLREAIKGNFYIPSYVLRINNEPFTFNNLGIAYIVKSESIDNLNQLLKNEAFVPSPLDFTSFVSGCLANKWSEGLRYFLSSFQNQVIFSSIKYEQQCEIVASIIRSNI